MLEKVKTRKHREYMYAKTGNLYIDSQLSQGARMQYVDQFLRDSITGLMREGYEILKDTSTSPYAYKQRLVKEDLVTKVLAKAVKNGYIMKAPCDLCDEVNKVNKVNEISLNQTWPQYRCRYGEYNYYIETHQKNISYKNRKLTDNIKNEWKASCQKLDTIKLQLDENEIKEVTGITIEILNVYVSAEEEENLRYDLDSLISLKREANRQLDKKYKANWTCLWTLGEEMVRCEEYIHGFEAYPAVLFLVRVD